MYAPCMPPPRIDGPGRIVPYPLVGSIIPIICICCCCIICCCWPACACAAACACCTACCACCPPSRPRHMCPFLKWPHLRQRYPSTGRPASSASRRCLSAFSRRCHLLRTALSERPGRSCAMRDHLQPDSATPCRMVESSDGRQGVTVEVFAFLAGRVAGWLASSRASAVLPAAAGTAAVASGAAFCWRGWRGGCCGSCDCGIGTGCWLGCSWFGCR
mmetsp:Transcript_28297/g.85544  ORF Transcript_28297/g.85544 Transcript_28297/m.85544 type:complete len:217 (-) Transcript_28297:501-1151(-)